MSQENVEVVRGCVEAWSRWHLEDMASFYSADVDIVSPTAELFGRRYRGHAGLRSYFEDFIEAFEPIELKLEALLDGGEKGVVCVIWFRARGNKSGAEVHYRNASVMTVRDGLIHREVIYTDPAEALEAIGLSERDTRADS